jgi:catechol 2,3-dioxygenase-like lactoylglutathione lyase family enzyme
MAGREAKLGELPGAYAFDHAGFTVPDLEEAVAFFTGLGCELLYREGPYQDEQGDSMRRQVAVHPRSTCRLAMLRFGSTTTLELLEYRSPDAASVPPKNSDHSAAHLGFRVRDIETATEHMRRLPGVQVLEGPVEVPDGPSAGLRWVYVIAPWGLQLELVELPPAMAEN